MYTLAFFTGSPVEWGIILVIVLVLFGGSKLAGLGKSMGEGIREFKKATQEDEPPPAPPAVTTSATPPVIAAKTEEK